MAPRTLTQYAPIVDVTEPGLFALLATAFAFTFNSRNEAEPEHQDVIFRATYDDRTDPADLVWSSENELGTVIPLRQPRQAMVVGGSEAQAVKYGSITLDRPEALALPAGTPAGNAIQTVAQLTASQYMLINNGSAGARLERFVVAADGTLSAQSLVATLTGGADDVFSVAGASTAGDALILHDADGGSLSMQRYRASSDDLIALSEAQLVDLDTMNAPVGIAHHGSTTFIAVDNTPQSVPALYLLTITQNAVAQLTSLGTVTAMSGLSAQGLMIDTPGQAVIAASDGRMWRVFYDVDTGLGDAVAMSKPNGLISPVSGLAVLPPPAAAGIRWMDVADFGASQRVAVSVTNADDDSDTATISRLRAGSDAITVIPTNEAIVLPTSAEGVVSSYTGAEGEIRVYRGSVRLTEGVTFTRVAVDSNLTATVNGTTGAYSITNLAAAADQANLVIRVEVDGEFTIDKIITVTKAQQGPRGSGIYSRMVDPAVWSTAEANTATPGENRLGDRVTLYNEAERFAETRFWTGLAWEVLVQVIDGSLVVQGTIAGNALVIGSGLVVAADGSLTVGGTIQSSNYTAGEDGEGWLIDTAGNMIINAAYIRGMLGGFPPQRRRHQLARHLRRRLRGYSRLDAGGAVHHRAGRLVAPSAARRQRSFGGRPRRRPLRCGHGDLQHPQRGRKHSALHHSGRYVRRDYRLAHAGPETTRRSSPTGKTPWASRAPAAGWTSTRST